MNAALSLKMGRNERRKAFAYQGHVSTNECAIAMTRNGKISTKRLIRGNHHQRRDGLLSVVLPVFNERAVLRPLTNRLHEVLTQCEQRFEIVFVNDGSTDGSGKVLDELAAGSPAVRVIHFSRNFGHQSALQAGLAYARGDAVVVMDSDLQDDPEAIPQFLLRWEEGYDVVYAVRWNRKENPIKRGLFSAFYRVLNALSQTRMPMDAGNFGLVDRRVANEITSVIDRDRYYPGLRSWVGFRQIGVPVERGRRYDEQPRVSLWGLFRLAKTAIFSFSSVPLSVFYVIAAVSLLAGFGVAGYAIFQKLFTDLAIPGWASTMTIGCFFGALNALGIAVLGEYATRIYDQVRARPSYIVDRVSERRPTLRESDDSRSGDEWPEFETDSEVPEKVGVGGV